MSNFMMFFWNRIPIRILSGRAFYIYTGTRFSCSSRGIRVREPCPEHLTYLAGWKLLSTEVMVWQDITRCESSLLVIILISWVSVLDGFSIWYFLFYIFFISYFLYWMFSLFNIFFIIFSLSDSFCIGCFLY